MWVDDDRFDLDAHLRFLAVPAPGDNAALEAIAGWILSRPLDRSRPLWELWVLDGLAGGGFAIVFERPKGAIPWQTVGNTRPTIQGG